jgi:polysaccharide deacetylase family protein (PEP-CTERM system associated)
MTVGGRTADLLPPGEPAFAMTIDVEDWFHMNFRSAPVVDATTLPRRVEAGVERILETLAAARARATFFVLGCVARDHPGLVGRIVSAGHEIGCHGMTHALVYEQRPEEFRAAVSDARKLLCDQSGQPVLGFRAPSWSITGRSVWAFDVLAGAGYRWDSSVFPAANYLYGIADAPRTPYLVPTSPAGVLVEVPPAVMVLGPVRVGVGGGFYLRVFPLWFHRLALALHARRGAPFVIHIHPREVDAGAWRLGVPLSRGERIIRDFNLRSVPRKLGRLLAGRTWEPVGDVLRRRGVLA